MDGAFRLSVLRPLFVSEVGYKSTKFSVSKNCLLIITGTQVVVVNVSSQGELDTMETKATVLVDVAAKDVSGVHPILSPVCDTVKCYSQVLQSSVHLHVTSVASAMNGTFF